MQKLMLSLLAALGILTSLGCGRASPPRPLTADQEQKLRQQNESVEKEEWEHYVSEGRAAPQPRSVAR